MTSDADSPGESSRFGSDMARRVRPRTARLRRHANHHFVGAVGRSSVGFGRAVGRSGAVRPVVDARNLDTYALRPPRGWWHTSAADAEESFDTARVDTAPGVQAVPSARPREVRRATTWTNRLLPAPTARRAPSRRSGPTTQTPTRATRATPVDAAPADEFRPSGDARWDALRRAFAAGLTPEVLKRGPEAVAEVLGQPASADDPTADVPLRRVARRARAAGSNPSTDGERTDPGADGIDDATARDGRRGDTSAGRDTGPGGLGRRVRPEPADPEQVARRKGADAGTSTPLRPGVPSGSGPAAPGRAPQRAVQRSAPSALSEVDDLRARWAAIRGAAGRDTPTADTRTADTRTASPNGPGDGSAPPRTTAAPSRQARRRPAPASPIASAAPTAPAASSPSSARPSPASPARSISRTPTPTLVRTASDDIDRPSASEPTGSLARRTGAVERVAREPLTRAAADLQLGSDRGGTLQTIAPPAGLPAQRPNLRVQRMIAAGHAWSPRDELAADVASTVRGLSSQLATVSPPAPISPAGAHDPSATATRTPGAAPAPPARPHRLRRRLPELPSVNSRHDALIRRLSIPRAMSAAHRPDSVLPLSHRGVPAPAPSPSFRSVDGPATHTTSADRETAHPMPPTASSAASPPLASPVSRPRTLTFPGHVSLAMLRRAVDVDAPVMHDAVPARDVAGPEPVRTERALGRDHPRSPRLPSSITRRRPSTAPLVTTDEPTAQRATVPRPLVIGQRRASTVVRTADVTSRPTTPPHAIPMTRPTIEFVDTVDTAGIPDLARVSVAPPSSIAAREPVGDDTPAARVEDRHQPTVPDRTTSRPRELRRQRVNHLTNDWSLVAGSTGALNHVVRTPAARSPHHDRGAARTEFTADAPAVRRSADARSSETATSPGQDHGTPPAAVARAAAPAGNDLAERFMTELSRSMRSRPAPLPIPFRPMADQITGGRNVMLSTDSATRKALRSVGKVAATTGDTIHLDPSATSAARTNHVVAHELTHIANPSPVARFFDDAIDSPEERQAEATAKIMTRSPLAPSASILRAPGVVARRSSSSGGDTIRRTAAPSSSSGTGSSPGTLNAESLAAAITGNAASGRASSSSSSSGSSGSSGSSSVIHRALESATPQAERAGSGPQGGSGRSSQDAGEHTLRLGREPFDPDSYAAKEWFLEQLDKNADAIVRLLSDRIVTDLERRGGRMWGGI